MAITRLDVLQLSTIPTAVAVAYSVHLRTVEGAGPTRFMGS
jgi:hypothetical protein